MGIHPPTTPSAAAAASASSRRALGRRRAPSRRPAVRSWRVSNPLSKLDGTFDFFDFTESTLAERFWGRRDFVAYRVHHLVSAQRLRCGVGGFRLVGFCSARSRYFPTLAPCFDHDRRDHGGSRQSLPVEGQIRVLRFQALADCGVKWFPTHSYTRR
jgi:hypothetical protein